MTGPGQNQEDWEQLRQTSLATVAGIRAIERRAQEALEARSSELAATVALLHATLDSSPDGILVFDLSGKAVLHNSRFFSIWHLAEEPSGTLDLEQIRARIRAMVVDEALYVRCLERSLMQPEAPACDEFTLKDGRVFERYSAPQLIDGKCAGAVLTWREITARKKVETEGRALEQRMRDQQRMESLGTLAGGLAHEFNNLLATILGNADLARQDTLAQPAVQESLEEIRHAGVRGRDLVQQILAFSRRQPTLLRPVSLAPLLTELVRMLKTTLLAQGATELQVAPNLPMALADAAQVRQVLVNLITNAVQAMQDRPGHITITAEPAAADAAKATGAPGGSPGGYVRIAVRDTGHGMDAATMARMYEPFYSTRTTGQGAGLGLSVAHGILTAHNGYITAESTPGQGSTFTFYIPALAETSESATATAAAGPEPAKPRILYVDDDTSILFLVRRMLERRGFVVLCHSDQQAALRALRADPEGFALALTDYNMPGMSGIEVARAMRAIRPGLPIALISGFITDELRASAAELGVHDLIYKPNTVDELAEAIERLVVRPS